MQSAARRQIKELKVNQMKIAIDICAVTNGDMDFSEFEQMGDVKYFDSIPREELYKLASDCDAIIVNKLNIDEEFLSRCPKIRYVGVFATGYNVIDLNACRAHGVTVCNVPNYSTYSVAQHVFALLLNMYGAITQCSDWVARGEWTKSKSFTSLQWRTREVYGKTFGIYGYGNIGKQTARIAEALGANVIVCTRTKPQNCPYPLVNKEELFSKSDIISLHCALTPETAKLIDRNAISLMKRDAVIINTARGGLVDESALADALNTGAISGACLDTVDEEPMLPENPLLNAKNCIITPHVGWIPQETRARLVKLAAANLRAFLDGAPQNVVS